MILYCESVANKNIWEVHDGHLSFAKMRIKKHTCTYKTGAASVNEIVIVGQDKGAPLLHLQAVLTTGDSLSAVQLGGLEVLRTQPRLVRQLQVRGRHRDKTIQM